MWELDLAKDAYAELGEYFRKFDPLHEREEAIFEKLGYIDVQYLCRRIRSEVFYGRRADGHHLSAFDAICRL